MNDEKAPKNQRIPIMMTKHEVIAVDDWRFSNRISTRAEAIRILLKSALVSAADNVRKGRDGE